MSCNTFLTVSELNRYNRQMRLSEIGKEGQEKIKGASVVVIGAGALGCPVLQYLAAAGVGIIGIVDNDWVDESNLHRQLLYGVKDIEKPKPLAARDKLLLNNPEIKIIPHFIRFTKETALNIIREYDIIVDCTDNFATRYLINDAAVLQNKPVVYGAIHRFSGQVMVLNYLNGPTLRCIYPTAPHPLEVPSCQEEGTIGSIAGTIGTMQATEVIKIILGLDGILSGKMFFLDSLNFTSQVLSFVRDPINSVVNELGTYEELCLSEKELVREITAQKLKEMIFTNPELKVIDLREEYEKTPINFKTVSIPFHEINQKLHLIPQNGPKVFYCGHGIKSSIVINYLQKVHYMNDLYSLTL
jgi:sulfur-carrier protein adenylyltransferase/sulfurtransferase